MEHQQDPKHGPPPTVRPSRGAEPRLARGTGERLPLPRDERELSGDEVCRITREVRDPLSRITLEAYLLDRKLANGDPSDGRQSLARIIRNIELLDRILQDLLDSCAAGTGRLELRHRPTELRALAERVIARVVSARDGGRVLLDAPFPIAMSIDGLRIERVLANLVGNALESSPRDSRILVRLEAAALSARISVIDTGPGLGPADLARVFDRDHGGTSADPSDRSGLGLHASKLIVEAHGGKLDVESVPGQGFRFYFDLPAIST